MMPTSTSSPEGPCAPRLISNCTPLSRLTRRVGMALTTILGLALAQSPAAQAQCPVPASCTPGNASNPNAGFLQSGVYSVRIGSSSFTVSHSGASVRPYQDQSCILGFNLLVGSLDSIVIRTGALADENLRVFLDLDNNGILTSQEQIFSSNGARIHRGTITLPASVTVGARLRLRITSDLNVSPFPGPCTTPEYGQAIDYYVQAGVNTAPPVASFSTPDTVTCSGVVRFTNQSSGGPTQFAWTFGDGGTSTVASPTHIYLNPGTYTVRLIVSNAIGSDTLVRSAFIRYSNLVPAPATCSPTTQANCCGYGVTRISLEPLTAGAGNLENRSATGVAGYEDFTCRIQARLTEGLAYRLILESAATQPQQWAVWLDLNNDGAFTADERMLQVASALSINETIVLPMAGTRIGVPLRLRVSADGAGTAALGPCTNPALGQVEDYTVILTANTLPPLVNFTAQAGSGCDSTYTFTSTSTNRIDSLRWDFGDGTQESVIGSASTIQHTYQTPGVYDVTLTAYGPNGVRSLTRPGVGIFALAPPAACASVTTNSCCGLGILQVQLAQINVTSGQATEGYQDFTCQGRATVLVGQAIPFSIRIGGSNRERLGIWVDLNRDGAFTPEERLFLGLSTNQVVSGSIFIPTTTPVGVPLRMRIVSRSAQTPDPQPCGSYDFGQTEDYTLFALTNTAAPVASFFSLTRINCSGMVSFNSDSSQNQITSYEWAFGDGNTSTDPNPSHQYATQGTYTVRLIVSGPFGADTLERVNYVQILQNLNLAPVVCEPPTVNYCCNMGVIRVQLANVDHSSPPGSEGYQDLTCQRIASLQSGLSYPISVTIANAQSVGIWADWNSDGAFDPVTEVVFFTNRANTGTLTATLQVPPTAITGRGLRLRLAAGMAGNGNPVSPCVVGNGQAEDYTILIQQTQIAPTAQFEIASLSTCEGTVRFRSLAQGTPTNYLWDFGDGQTDTLSNPVHRYTAPGTYNVRMIVTNAFGADTLLQVAAVTITRLDGIPPAQCRPIINTSLANNIGTGTLGPLTWSSLPVGPIQDDACTREATLTAGQTITYRLTSAGGGGGGGGVFLRAAAYLDLNGDGTFTLAERMFEGTLNGGVLTGSYVVPAPTSLPANGQVRLRVIYANAQEVGGGFNTVPACGTFNQGYMLDATARILVLAPVAEPRVLSAVICSNYAIFQDSSSNGVTSRLWDFGDGNTDTIANPIHFYTTPGIYNVRLIVRNAVGVDTAFVQVAVTNTMAMPLACIPDGVNIQARHGILNLTLSGPSGVGINRSSGNALEGYRDFACTDSIVIVPGFLHTYQVTTTLAQSPQIRPTFDMYLDVNSDGIFSVNERVVRQTVPTPQIQGSWIPAASLASNIRQTLRLRVVMGNYSTAQCTVSDGQVEDYMVIVPAITSTGPLVTLDKPGMTLFPNPASADQGTLVRARLHAPGTATLTVLDATGRRVQERIVTVSGAGLETTLETASLPAGIYMVRLVSGRQVLTHRLTLTR